MTSNPLLTFAITVCNEKQEVIKLISTLVHNKFPIVVLWDMNSDIEVWNQLAKLKLMFPQISLYARPFDNDFAEHKNYLNSKCNTEWILQLDADELLTDSLLDWLENKLCLYDDRYKLFFIPRMNIVKGITPEYVESQGWKYQNQREDWVQWPDYQGRLYRNLPEIKWAGKVHERIAGIKLSEAIGFDQNIDKCLIHVKSFYKQKSQNELYSKIGNV
jgi:hypothetical protein